MAENKDSPSSKEWEALYEAAGRFKTLHPWTWMSDADLFGVQNPEDEEIGYCCIMGMAKQVYALAVYEGQEGLDGYLRLQSGQLNPNDPAIAHIQKCLMASFEDRDYLDKEDLQTIKKLNLTFRGRKAWPQFRSYLPGYVPWFLTAKEARYLRWGLLQAVDVAQRVKKEPDLLNGQGKTSCLIRMPLSKKGPLKWEDGWIKIAVSEKEELTFTPIDELRVHRIGKEISNKGGVWEIDFFQFPGAVQEKGRPFYPKTFMIMDHLSGMALHYSMEHPKEFHSKIQETLIDFIEKIKVIPEQILVSKYENHQSLQPLASKLTIDLKRVKNLKAAEQFKDSMYNHFLK